MKIRIVVMLGVFILGTSLFAEQSTIKLPKHNIKGSLQYALENRSTNRSLVSKELSEQQLSNILWAGFGINRKDGKRTAPTADDARNITIYAAMAKGLYKYNAEANSLELIINKDVRGDWDIKAL